MNYTQIKLTNQTWEFGGFKATYDYESEYWTVAKTSWHSLEGLSFGKPSIKAARLAIRYAEKNNIF